MLSMLSVATPSAVVHCSEKPKSSSSRSSHSGLAIDTGSWSSDHSPLKRRNSQQRCSSPNKDVASLFRLSNREITLSLVSPDDNGCKRPRRDSERSVDSGVTLRYKDPKTEQQTEKVLDNKTIRSLDTSNNPKINHLLKKSAEETSGTKLNDFLEKISPEITIYPRQEVGKQSVHSATSNKSVSQTKDCTQTVYKVSPEVELISSPKSNQGIKRKFIDKQEATSEASNKYVPEENAKSEALSTVKVRTFDTNHNLSHVSTKERGESRMSKALQHLKSLKKDQTPDHLAIKESKVLLAPERRETLDTFDEWNDIFGSENIVQDVSSSTISMPDQIFNFSDDPSPENPYYALGFPNPPGENRCWVNATLHALFALPYINRLDSLKLPECSQLIKTLISVQSLWKKGAEEKHKVHQMLKKFKDELVILDESYPSDRQQDVSEFLMKFLNYLKGEFEKLLCSDAKLQEIENVPENPQDLQRKSKTTADTNKRRPLVDIPSVNGKLRRNSILSESTSSQKSLKAERLSTGTETSKDNSESEELKNPIDEYFLLQMVEQVVCKGCSEKRQNKVDNLMLYVEFPLENKNEPANLEEAIARTFATEERHSTCEKCKHNLHDVRTAFSRHPKVLIVQINRYGMGENGMKKICNAVSIPGRLAIKPSLMSEGFEADEMYKPICIISHVGESMDCGHYTCYVEHGDQWFHYNDMRVYPMTSSEALEAAQNTAYLVFFAKVNLLKKPN